MLKLRHSSIDHRLMLALALILSSLVTTTWAQSAGATKANLSGMVRDKEAAVVGGAAITIKNADTGFTRETITSSDGIFLVPQLQPGSYIVTVMADGFETQSLKCNVALGNTNTIDVTLQLGQTVNVVEVNATTTDLLKTENATNVSQDRIESLPINRRDFIDFTLTSSRVVADRLPAQGIAATSGLSFNGQSARFNNITIDGIDNNDITSGTVRTTFSQEAVQEFQVVSDSSSAEYGRALGGIVNIVTRGGSNEFHGTLFSLNRNDKLSARDAFVSFKPDFAQYQFGGSFSGPIKKDKAFFFSSFERLSVKQNNIVVITDDVIQALRDIGLPANNGARPFSVGRTTALGRVDAQLTPNDTIYFRYNYGGTYDGSFEPFGGLSEESNGGVERLKDNSIAVSNTYLLPKLNIINETRFLYGNRTQTITPLSSTSEIDIATDRGSAIYGQNVFTPQLREENIVQIVDTVTLTKGRNQIKFGVDYNRISSPKDKSVFGFDNAGVANFSAIDFSSLLGMPNLPFFTVLQALDPKMRTPQQNAFLTFLAGALPSRAPGFPQNVDLANTPIPLIYAQSFGALRMEIPVSLFSVFVQNDLRLKPNLLIKTGLRYDRNRIGFTPNNNGNVSPRVAFAYQPSKLPRLNLRASYGIFFGTPVFGPAVLAAKSQSNQIQLPAILFPLSIIPFTLPNYTFPQTSTLPPGITLVPQLALTYQYDRNLRNSYSQQVSTAIDYVFNDKTGISVEYNYVRGNKLLAAREINPVIRPVPNDRLQSLLTGRIFPDKGRITDFESAFDSYYNGLTLTLNHRVAEKFSLVASYTFAKTIDNLFDIRTDVAGVANNPLTPGMERGLSLQDVRSRFVFSGFWKLDYTKNPFLKDFVLSTIVTLESGRPYNILAGTDLNLNGDGGRGDRPLGLGRNVGITPGLANVDMRLSRSISIKERYKVQAFFEAFNLFNRTNIRQVSSVFMPDAQGNFNLPKTEGGRYPAPRDHYLAAASPRQFQLGFRFSF